MSPQVKAQKGARLVLRSNWAQEEIVRFVGTVGPCTASCAVPSTCSWGLKCSCCAGCCRRQACAMLCPI